jgi:hypothetical protein
VADGDPARRRSGRVGPLAPEAPGLRSGQARLGRGSLPGSVRPRGGVAGACPPRVGRDGLGGRLGAPGPGEAGRGRDSDARRIHALLGALRSPAAGVS